jgi:hypothetical protein
VKPGDVFCWKAFPFPQKGGEIKLRWFIYLGDSGIFSNPIFAYICTTTTQRKDFQKGEKRAEHRYLLFRKGEFPFEEECLLDFDELPYQHFTKEALEKNPDIEIKGTLEPRTIRTIYEGIYYSKLYSPRMKRDIRESLNQIGITGLRKI